MIFFDSSTQYITKDNQFEQTRGIFFDYSIVLYIDRSNSKFDKRIHNVYWIAMLKQNKARKKNIATTAAGEKKIPLRKSKCIFNKVAWYNPV